MGTLMLTIKMQDAVALSTSPGFVVQGGSFELAGSNSLSLSGSFDFSSLEVTNGAISFGVQENTVFNGTIVIPVSCDNQPELEIMDLGDEVLVSWSDPSGS